MARVYAEETERTVELKEISGPRFKIEDLFHDYWLEDNTVWSLSCIAALRSVVG